jgi:hypothetical protein
MANQQTVVLVQDPQWFLKLVVASVVLAVLLTIASYLAKAQRNTFVLTFPIALAVLLVGHFAVRISLSSPGLLIAATAMVAILFRGVRYILIARPLASVLVVMEVTVIFVIGLATALAIVGS